MCKKLFAAMSVLAVAAPASAEITDIWVQPCYEGYLWFPSAHVFSYDLCVEITGDDAWTVAGGLTVGAPWCTVTGGTFYQSPANDTNPPNPAFFSYFPCSGYTSFYTTHLGYPNVPSVGVSPGFAYGPSDTDTELIADWFWTPDGNYYPGEFMIARLTVIAPPDADPAQTYVDVDMLIGSLETIPPIRYQIHVPVPEPTSLVLLALCGSLWCGRGRMRYGGS